MNAPAVVPPPTPPRPRIPWADLAIHARRSQGAVVVGSWPTAERADSIRTAGQAWLRRNSADDLRVVRRSDSTGFHVLMCRADGPAVNVERMPTPPHIRVAGHIDSPAADAAIRTHNLILSSAGAHSDGIIPWVRGACWGIRHTLEAFGVEVEEVQP